MAAAAHLTDSLQQAQSNRLPATELPEKICQRNYVTVANLLHQRIKKHDETSNQLAHERAAAARVREELAEASSRAAAAELQVQQHLEQAAELQVLRTDNTRLSAAKHDTEQQCKALQEQLARIKSDLYGTMSAKQSALQLLQEREQQLSSVTAAANTCKQQLEALQSEYHVLSSQMAALQEEHQKTGAAQQEAASQLATARTRLRAAEEAASAHTAMLSQLQATLAMTEASLATETTQVQRLTQAHQQLSEELKRQREACGEEQAAHGHAAAEIQSLQAQLAAACSRAEAAERQQQASVTASAVALSRAQHDLQEARSAQFVAEEAHKTADAAAKLLAIKVTEAQRDTAQQQGVADAAKQELRKQLSDIMGALEVSKQQTQAWQFRQLEFMTRVLHQVESLEARVADGSPLCSAPATAQLCSDKLDGLAVGLDEAMAGLSALVASCSRLTTSLDALSPRGAGSAT